MKLLKEGNMCDKIAENIEKFEDLKGHTLEKVERRGDDELVFTLNSGESYKLWHWQDCCEDVRIEDVVGELDDLVGSPLLMAEEAESENKNPEGVTIPDYQDSFTWTFYKLATIKGYVTIRWYGESNGYYSESVEFSKASKFTPW